MAKKATKPVDYSKPLKNKQRETFCQYQFKLNNGTQAAIKAKYSKRSAGPTACRLLTIDSIKKRIDYLQAKVAKSIKLSVESVIDDILDTRRRAKDDDEYKVELKASDMIMRHLGGYEKDNNTVAIVIDKPLTEIELKERLSAVEAAGNGIDVGSIK
jgi:hypothetical protein